MKAWIISDLHIGPRTHDLIVPDADICLCAGDISDDPATSVDFLKSRIAPHMPVVFTLGNHECYGRSIDQAIDITRRRTAGTNIHFLENEAIDIGRVRFIGATLWTDFEIATGEDDADLPKDLRLEIARKDIRHHVTDFYEIRSDQRPGQFVDVDELRARHIASRDNIRNELEGIERDQIAVVLTHHAPLFASLDPSFDGNLSNAAYASDLSVTIEVGRPDYWIHGHIHQFQDYRFDHTRIICNPRGKGDERGRNGFQPEYVIEIGKQP